MKLQVLTILNDANAPACTATQDEKVYTKTQNVFTSLSKTGILKSRIVCCCCVYLSSFWYEGMA